MKMLLLVIALMITLSGCLGYATKEFVYAIKSNGSGRLTVICHDLRSVQDPELTEDPDPADDYRELLSSYIYGNSAHAWYPTADLVGEPQIWDENGVLSGSTSFDFTSPQLVGIYLDTAGRYYFDGARSQTYLSSNGVFEATEDGWRVYWEKGTEKLQLTIKDPDSDETGTSLISEYHKSLANRK